jgi:uncharacterized Tic20 family protein
MYAAAAAMPQSANHFVDDQASSSERTYALFNHLTLLFVHFGVPVIPALVMWLIRKADSPFLDDHGKEAVNFQISLILHAIIIFALGFVTCFVAWLLYFPLWALGIYGSIMAAIAANKGEFYRYPMSIRLIR